jgi:hypothetical protein
MSRNSILVSERRRKLKSMVVEYMGGKCQRCGWNEHQSGLVPHHANPSKKEFSISGDGIPRTWAKIQEECKKCFLLCQNCHSVVHATQESYWFDENNIPDYGEFIDTTSHAYKVIFKCIDCDIEISHKATRCMSCSGRHNALSNNKTKINWPQLDILLGLVEMHGYSGVGKILGVSDKAVAKRIKTQQKYSAE